MTKDKIKNCYIYESLKSRLFHTLKSPHLYLNITVTDNNIYLESTSDFGERENQIQYNAEDVNFDDMVSDLFAKFNLNILSEAYLIFLEDELFYKLADLMGRPENMDLNKFDMVHEITTRTIWLNKPNHKRYRYFYNPRGEVIVKEDK